jgi:hypothetical protein
LAAAFALAWEPVHHRNHHCRSHPQQPWLLLMLLTLELAHYWSRHPLKQPPWPKPLPWSSEQAHHRSHRQSEQLAWLLLWPLAWGLVHQWNHHHRSHPLELAHRRSRHRPNQLPWP